MNMLTFYAQVQEVVREVGLRGAEVKVLYEQRAVLVPVVRVGVVIISTVGGLAGVFAVVCCCGGGGGGGGGSTGGGCGLASRAGLAVLSSSASAGVGVSLRLLAVDGVDWCPFQIQRRVLVGPGLQYVR